MFSCSCPPYSETAVFSQSMDSTMRCYNRHGGTSSSDTSVSLRRACSHVQWKRAAARSPVIERRRTKRLRYEPEVHALLLLCSSCSRKYHRVRSSSVSLTCECCGQDLNRQHSWQRGACADRRTHTCSHRRRECSRRGVEVKQWMLLEEAVVNSDYARHLLWFI